MVNKCSILPHLEEGLRDLKDEHDRLVPFVDDLEEEFDEKLDLRDCPGEIGHLVLVRTGLQEEVRQLAVKASAVHETVHNKLPGLSSATLQV